MPVSRYRGSFCRFFHLSELLEKLPSGPFFGCTGGRVLPLPRSGLLHVDRLYTVAFLSPNS